MSTLTEPVDPAVDHQLGTGAVQLVMYGDYQCPYSLRAWRSCARVVERHGDTVAFVFRHFPLRSKHPDAEGAARLAEAAGDFWAEHRRLFEHQRELGALVAEAGAAVEDPAVAARVQRDVDSGTASGVDGTPRFFLDGEPYTGFYDVETLLEEVELRRFG